MIISINRTSHPVCHYEQRSPVIDQVRTELKANDVRAGFVKLAVTQADPFAN